MAADKYTATWVSHSSISDFLACPRAYYLKNVYKDPKTGHKVQLVSPYLSLGSAVHEVVESLSTLPTKDRFNVPLVDRFEQIWDKYSGEKGGFTSKEYELKFKQRGLDMLNRVQKHPGPLVNLAVKVNMDLPYYWISEEDNIILCGKIDWLEYLPDEDAVHIIDFKTSRSEEDPSSLQLPIYHLLVHHTQHRPVAKASYWYLELNDELTPKELPDLAQAEKEVLNIAKKIKLTRQLERYTCPHGGCRACLPYESVLEGKAKLVGINDYSQDLYLLPPQEATKDSQVL